MLKAESFDASYVSGSKALSLVRNLSDAAESSSMSFRISAMSSLLSFTKADSFSAPSASSRSLSDSIYSSAGSKKVGSMERVKSTSE